jgi:CheY-like chemotaxis protein
VKGGLRDEAKLATTTKDAEQMIRILHVSNRETLQKLRDDILRLHGYHVDSTLFHAEALDLVQKGQYDLVLIDVEGENRVKQAEYLCDHIKKSAEGQRIAYVCNYRLAVESDCPDEVIRAEFDPEALVRYVRHHLAELHPKESNS